MNTVRSKVVLMALVLGAILQFFFWNKTIHKYAFNLGIRTAEIIESPMESNNE